MATVTAARDAYKSSAAARKRLETAPGDPEANRIVGWFLCSVKNDWDRGLPMLAIGDDAELKAAAGVDLASKDGIATGDSWMKVKGAQDRALFWYKKTLPDLKGVAKVRVEKLIVSMEPGWQWRDLDVTEATVMDGFLRIKKDPNWGGSGLQTCRSVRTKQKVVGGFDVTIVARTEKNNIRIYGPSETCVIFNWEQDPKKLVVNRPDGSVLKAPTKPLLPSRWYTLRWTINDRQTDVYVDGVRVFTEKNNFGLPEHIAPISVWACDSDVDVKSIIATPIR